MTAANTPACYGARCGSGHSGLLLSPSVSHCCQADLQDTSLPPALSMVGEGKSLRALRSIPGRSGPLAVTLSQTAERPPAWPSLQGLCGVPGQKTPATDSTEQGTHRAGALTSPFSFRAPLGGPTFQRGHRLCPEVSWEKVTSTEPRAVDTTPRPDLFSDLEQVSFHSVANSSPESG